jgi:hypothetical protein
MNVSHDIIVPKAILLMCPSPRLHPGKKIQEPYRPGQRAIIIQNISKEIFVILFF